MLSTEIVQFQLTNKGHKNYIIIKLHKLEEGILWRFFMRWKKNRRKKKKIDSRWSRNRTKNGMQKLKLNAEKEV